MKNVLLLGDSIRMLYQRRVKAELKGKANVYGPDDNGRWSGYTLNTLRFWLPSMPDPDIVHWNNGIWDIGDDYNLGRPFTLPEEYEVTLERTVVVLRQLCGADVKIIMATTTPSLAQPLETVEQYNEILKKVAANNGIEVDDLFSVIRPNLEGLISPDKIHLNMEGAKLATESVVASIVKYL